MIIFEKLKRNLEYLKQGGLIAIIQDEVINESTFVMDLNRDAQLYDKGIKSDGERLPEYTSFTKTIKKSKGQPYDRMTLRDTESFHKKFFLKMDNMKFRIDSTDKKRNKLVERFTGFIFGLTPENKNILAHKIAPNIIKKIKFRL
jgi:uncharacterized protein YjhX (UPF0386 family)